jgi:hypothetical protein
MTATLFPAACLVWSSAIHAQERYAVFFPLLVDLPAWKGNKPQGLTMKVPGIIIATREYQRGDARVNVSVTAGQSKLTTPAPAGTVNAGDTRISVAIIDGWQVGRTFNVNDKWGGVKVDIATNAYFMLLFNGVSEDEALKLARQFDWKALQAAAPTLQ